MQKLLKRTATAERTVARRAAKQERHQKRSELRVDFNSRMRSYGIVNKIRIDARCKQREDWALGPLAPQRDTPIQDEHGGYFGATSAHLQMAPFGERQINLACKWAGGKGLLCLKPGDRVAIMEGPDKGKIAPVRAIDMDKATVQLGGDDMNRNITINEYMYKAKPEIGRIQLTPMSVPIHAVRLVHPLVDPITGRTRDVVIKELVPRGVRLDKPTGRRSWSRVVPGLNIEIPWPRAFEEEEKKELEAELPEYKCDTLRIDVEERTWMPTLLTPPMPRKVLDELRNPYSKFRTRHEDEYIQKIAGEVRKKRIEKGEIAPPEMRTPLQELNHKIRAVKRARGQPELTEQMLIRIGKIMAKEDGRRFQGKSMKEVDKQIKAGKTAAKANLPPQGKTASTIPPPSPDSGASRVYAS